MEEQYSDKIICPYCGHEETDSWEYTEEEDEIECEECGKRFIYNREVEIHFTTMGRCHFIDKKHYFKEYINKLIKDKKYYRCTECDLQIYKDCTHCKFFVYGTFLKKFCNNIERNDPELVKDDNCKFWKLDTNKFGEYEGNM